MIATLIAALVGFLAGSLYARACMRAKEHDAVEAPDCDRPPKGWYCIREKGHSGACAAYPWKGGAR